MEKRGKKNKKGLNINKYWKFLAKDLKKEQKCRKRMNKVIKKMRKKVSFFITARYSFLYERKDLFP